MRSAFVKTHFDQVAPLRYKYERGNALKEMAETCYWYPVTGHR